MTLSEARPIAGRILALLQPHCDRIHIAGSIRREKPDVKDVEIVCQPKAHKDLFCNATGENDPAFVLAVMNLGKRIKGHATTGKYSQIQVCTETIKAIDYGPPIRTGAIDLSINLDLFMPSPHDYFRQLAIRTGSADYSARVIAAGWRRIGWVGTDNGLRLGKECDPKDLGGGKTKWICNHHSPTLPPVWQSEEEFFDWLGIQWIEPKYRI